MTPSARFAHDDGERGTILLFVALTIVGLLGICALVIDIASLRLDRRDDRSVADAGATAGATELGRSGDALAACGSAWGYVVANLELTGASPCTAGFPGGACNPAVARSAITTSGDYTVTITNPVPDTDTSYLDADLAGGDRTQAVTTADGEPCDRVGVRITRTRDLFFGGVFGVDSDSTTVHSVARNKVGTGAGSIRPALVTLDPTACPAVWAGNGQIRALAVGDMPGRIYTDTSGTGAGCGTAFASGPNGTVEATAGASGDPGELGHFAAAPNDFGTEGSFLGDRVQLTEPLTRNVVDSRYHCSLATPACPVPSDPIVDVVSRYGGNGLPNFTGSYTKFPGGGENCNSIPANFAAGNWYITCPNFTPVGTVTFGGDGVIVFNGDVTVSSATLRFSPSATSDTIVAIRGTTGLTLGGNGDFEMQRTMLYMDAGAVHQSGNGNVTWNAPTSGSFKDLMYWTESSVTHTFSGNPVFDLDGIWVMPNAKASLVGNGYVDATNVQFWANSVAAEGNGTLVLRPNPNRSLSLFPAGAQLIR